MNSFGSMRNSLVISTCLHVAMLLFVYFGLPSLFKPLPLTSPPVPLQIVEIADITNTRLRDNPDEATKPAPQPPPPKPTPPAESKPPEPKPSEQQPQPPQPDDLAAAPIPKPPVKPKPPEPPKPATDDLASVLKNVAKLKPTPKTDVTNPDKNSKASSEPKSMAPSLSDRLTISEEDALRRQIGECWNMPVGARNAENLVVEVLITVNPDRTVQSAQVVDQARMASDSFFRAAAESALRALRHPRCTPLAVPPDKYEQWKTIDFTFDPRDML